MSIIFYYFSLYVYILSIIGLHDEANGPEEGSKRLFFRMKVLKRFFHRRLSGMTKNKT